MSRDKNSCRAKTKYPDRIAAVRAKTELEARDTTVRRVEVIECSKPNCHRWHLRVSR